MSELKDYTVLIEEKLKELNFPSEPQKLYEPIQYILDLGGKRLRPALTLIAASLFRDDTSEAVPAALALEVFHNFTLLHDDIMDKAEIRRGKPTVHKVWNENVAILSGDAAIIKAYELLGQLPDSIFRKVFQVFNETALEVCEGQQYDMNFEEEELVTVPEYLEMIRLKTSVLIAAALKIGGICAGADAADQEILYELGINLGLAFQLQDDYLDVYASTEKFGKTSGGDIVNNKKTYLLINALNSDNKMLVEELKHWINLKDFNPPEKIEAVKKIYEELETGTDTQLQAVSFINNAVELLDSIDADSEKKKPLEELIFKLMYREK
ncbi:MAG: polyprenyl synthetase family protein [Bacteroidales bacterium]|nr:polyprenyl synthetase family protein [Bacteroidales bacterium]MBN2817419.1 polyprenyl synthetase family protein [Bacteroidales bacterium]